MIVRVNVPRALTEFSDGRREISLDVVGQPTVGDVVRALSIAYPALGRRIVDETGELRRYVNVYVGSEECRRRGGLAALVPADTEVHIIGSIAGG